MRIATPAVWWWTAGISLAVYGVLAYALTREPPVAVPQVLALLITAAPHLIAGINAAALVCLRLGYRAIRTGRIGAHRRYMLAAASLISAFLVLYVTRVALGGVKAFHGPEIVRTYLYLPILAIHVTLSVLSVPLIVHNVLVGLSVDPAEVGATAHPRVGRIAVVVWSTSLALGLVVYLLLNLAGS